MTTFEVDTPRDGFYPITEEVRRAVRASGAADGVCFVFCPHTTAGLCVSEGYDPAVQGDLAYAFDRVFPDMPAFRHDEGNSAAHVKSAVTGSSVILPVEGGDLVLGTWQAVYLAEFDAPRRRRLMVKVLG